MIADATEYAREWSKIAMRDNLDLKAGLLTLFQAASALGGWQKEQAAQFIRVGEYGLALDGIACAYLANKLSMPAHFFQLFDALAATMELETDPEYQAVAELRQTHAGAIRRKASRQSG